MLIISLSLLSTITIFSQSWKQYPFTPVGSAISFPEDEGRHPGDSIEWWYIAGHLTGSQTGIHYSFMLTYFYFPAYGYDGFRILNLSNDDTGKFFTETQPVYYTEMGYDSLNLQVLLFNDSTEHWTHKKNVDGNLIPFEYELSATGDHGSLDLTSISLKPPLILGDSGLFNQGEQSYTYYYSLTENTMSGTITFERTEEEVTGTAWIDRQYGDFNPIIKEKYEWFYVQLSNGMDINIWNLFTPDNHLPDTSTYRHISVIVDSSTQYTTHDFELERLDFQYMSDSVMCYAQKWRLTSPVNQVDLTITALHNHTEVLLPFRFFEGSTFVSGTVKGKEVTGQGFAELLKTYAPPKVSLISPNGGTWTDTIPITWHLNNPDDGRPLLYDLDYSTDGRFSFSSVAQGLLDTIFTWKDPASLVKGDSCWFRVTAYSSDHTLSTQVTYMEPVVYEPGTSTWIDQNHLTLREGITIFPVPAGEILYVKYPEQTGPNRYDIFDNAGKRIQTGVLEHFGTYARINLGASEPGIYYIQIYNGDKLYTTHFIKQGPNHP